MLDAFIIEEIKKREREQDGQRPRSSCRFQSPVPSGKTTAARTTSSPSAA